MPEQKAPFFERDREAAREAGRRGGLRRQELARLKREDPEAWARETFSSERAALSKELLDAALGRGAWHDLPLDKRLQALTKALEYAVGRPVARKDDQAPETQEPDTGLTIE
jgi:hypothetical protein